MLAAMVRWDVPRKTNPVSDGAAGVAPPAMLSVSAPLLLADRKTPLGPSLCMVMAPSSMLRSMSSVLLLAHPVQPA